MSFRDNIFHVFGLIDFGSDICVGINLYYACHFKFAAISFFLTALPSLLFFIYFAITSIFPKVCTIQLEIFFILVHSIVCNIKLIKFKDIRRVPELKS